MKNIMTTWRQFATWKRRSIASFLVVALIGGLGWLYIDYRFPSWDEEVMLSDGRMLIVHRRQEMVAPYGAIRTWLTFSLPEMGGKQTWTEWMYPAIVDVNEGKVYVVGLPIGRGQYLAYLQPRYLYVAYEYSSAGWKRIPFIGLPDRVRAKENILWCAERGVALTRQYKSNGWCGDRTYSPTNSPNINLSKRSEKAQELNGLAGAKSFTD